MDNTTDHAAPAEPDKWNADYLRRVHVEASGLLADHTRLLAELRDQVRDAYNVVCNTLAKATESGHLETPDKLEAMRDLSTLKNTMRAILGL